MPCEADKLLEKFLVRVIIENKPQARDPEGETVLKELIHRGSYTDVESIRVAKMLKMTVKASSAPEAKDRAFSICNDLRIFNPVAHQCTVETSDA